MALSPYFTIAALGIFSIAGPVLADTSTPVRWVDEPELVGLDIDGACYYESYTGFGAVVTPTASGPITGFHSGDRVLVVVNDDKRVLDFRGVRNEDVEIFRAEAGE